MNYNNELLKLYLKWIKEVDDSFFDPSNNFSNPYLISAPENWSYSYKNRIMIIGKEGYGHGAPEKEILIHLFEKVF